MDEVDIDTEDINELESRLYAQIHHESLQPITLSNVAVPAEQLEQISNGTNTKRIVTTTSVINRPSGSSRVPDTRYWANGLKQSKQPMSAQRTIAIDNGGITSTVAVVSKVSPALPENETTPTTITDAPITITEIPSTNTQDVRDKSNETMENPNKKVAGAATTNLAPALPENDTIICKQSNNRNQKKVAIKSAQQHKQKMQQESISEYVPADLLINPAAICKNKKGKQNKPQKVHIPRTGPFMQRELKLQKALNIEAKKQKSKKVHTKKKQRQQYQEQQNNVVTIVLESSEESENDEVLIVPTAPPPLITLDDTDTDNDNDEKNSSTLQLEEENAMDATDFALKKKLTFSKQKSIRGAEANDASGKVIEQTQISSRCTSPCSVLSSDDFIGQTDRSRLLKNNCIADDQDLALLTADVDSLIQTPQQVEKLVRPTKNMSTPQKSGCQEDDSSSNEVVCTAEFATPLASTSAAARAAAEAAAAKSKEDPQTDYRVDQTQFRALDVYESESDITDSVYSKGSGRATTVVLAAGSSSEEADDVQKTPVNQKAKRFVKRRTSSSNRGSDMRESNSTDSESDEEATDGVASIGIPYILRGEAIENNNKKRHKRSRSFSSRRISTSAKTSSGHMSDTEFITTLNNLVHGLQTISDSSSNEEDETSAQQPNQTTLNCDKQLPEEMANEVDFNDASSLNSVQIVNNEIIDAVPEDAVAGLDRVFETIDNLNKMQTKITPSDHSSDDDVEVVCTPTKETDNAKGESNCPSYHTIYSENSAQIAGFGWNDEMQKFYNSSWKGEFFTIAGVQNGMNRDKKLWKIYTEDRFPKGRPYSNLKCYNCCEFGHTRAKCRRPKKPPICYMCGESGHYEPRCPNTICLRCGNKTQMFTKSCNSCTFQNKLICPICKVRGHAINLCPDKWRRYHSTTTPNAYPDNQVVLNKRKMCCICGGGGHFSETCRSAVRFMEYPVIVSQVKSHQKSYTDLVLKEQPSGIAFNLLYKPSDIVQFHLAENIKACDYYGRFLKAVGLAHLLRRKRISNAAEKSERPSKQAKNSPVRNQLNPLENVSKEKSDDVVVIVPDQVQEVSGSDTTNLTNAQIVENASNDDAEVNIAIEEEQQNMDSSIARKDEFNEFKAPSMSPKSIALNTSQDKEAISLDSDSNYSFSEHFEIPNTSVSNAMDVNAVNNSDTNDMAPSTSKAAKSADLPTSAANRVRELEPLPDYIPLTESCENNQFEFADNIDVQSGISRRFIAADTDDETDDCSDNAFSDLPCEAKIYLTHFHSNFLLSPKGHEFLVEKSRENDVKARLDWTSVGHVLVLFGLPNDQDKFHQQLLLKYRDLSDDMNNKQLNAVKVPKRTDVLIRFLRDNILQLQNDLGDVNELQHRIKHLEKTQTKANVKLAEKFRRLLNMILLGQAGLCNGNMHLDKLLLNLRTLINDHQMEHLVPNNLREEIDTHSKAIFTSYRHNNYEDLIQAYNNMSTKSRIPNLNIDPLLLGQKLLNTSLTCEQKQRLEQFPQANPQKTKEMAPTNIADMVPNPLSARNSKLLNNVSCSPPPPAPSMRIPNYPASAAPMPKSFVKEKEKGRNKFESTSATPNQTAMPTSFKSRLNQSASTKRQSIAVPPFANPQQKSTVITKVKETAQNWKSACNTLFKEGLNSNGKTAGVGGFKQRGSFGAPSQGPSMFWSRESLRYLEECITLAESNAELLEKLKRIQNKSHEGALSYNDYRAVIKLHGAMIGN